MAQITAVEWLIEYIERENWSLPKDIEKQAKAMEMQQIKNAYYTDCITRQKGLLTPLIPIFTPFEKYILDNYEYKK